MSELALLWKEIAAIKGVLKRSFTEGTVTDVDPKTQKARIQIGEDADGKPVKSDWVPYAQLAGAMKEHVPVSVGQQMTMLAPMGDFRRAHLVPMTFSEENPSPSEKGDENVRTYGKYRSEIRADDTLERVGKSKRTATSDGKITEETGDQPDPTEGLARLFAANPRLGANMVHELNRQLQGLRADLTQARNEIAGVFEAASKMREICEGRVPGLSAIKDILDGKPESLEKATKAALGNLEGYMAKAFQGALGKLTNGFMSSVLGMVQGFVEGQIGGILGQIADLADLHGIADAIADPLGAAEGLIADAASGAAHNLLGDHLGAIEAAFAGTPGEAAFAALRGELGGILNGALDVAADLGGMLEGQQNLVKGMTRSYRLGGY